MNSNGKFCIFLRLGILTLSINLMIGVHRVRHANAQEKCDEVMIKTENSTFGGQYLKNKKLGPVSSASISPDGKIAVIGARSDKSSRPDKKLEQNLVVVDILETTTSISDPKIVRRKEISVEEDINSIAFHPSGKYFAVAFQDTIDIFDVNHLDRKPSTIRTQQLRIGKIGFSANGATLFSLDVQRESGDSLRQNNRDIVFYKFNSNSTNSKLDEIQTMGSESRHQYTAAEFHPDSDHLIIGGNDRENEFIKVYSIVNKKSFPAKKIIHPTGYLASTRIGIKARIGIEALSISQDGKYISSVNQSRQREVIIWNSTDLSQLSIKKRIETKWPVLSTAFSPNNQYLLVGEEALTSGDKCRSPVSLWSVADEGPKPLSFRYGRDRENEPVRVVVFGPDKKSIFFGSNDGFFNYLELDQRGQEMIN